MTLCRQPCYCMMCERKRNKYVTLVIWTLLLWTFVVIMTVRGW